MVIIKGTSRNPDRDMIYLRPILFEDDRKPRPTQELLEGK